MSERTIWEEFDEEGLDHAELENIAKEAVEFLLQVVPSLAGAKDATLDELASDDDVKDLTYNMLKVAAQWMNHHGVHGDFIKAKIKAAKIAGRKVRSREDMFGDVPEEFSGWLCEAYEEGRERAKDSAPDTGCAENVGENGEWCGDE